MSFSSENKTINSKVILITGIAVLTSWVFHEFAHWTTGTLLGYDMMMTLNKVFPVKGSYDSDWHYQIISAAGPAFTLAEALVVFFIMLQKRLVLLYPILFTCFYMRLLAAVISIRNPNDEARISKSIGVGTYTLPIIMVVILLALVYKISRKYNFSWKYNLLISGLVILFSSIIIMADQYFHIRLL